MTQGLLASLERHLNQTAVIDGLAAEEHRVSLYEYKLRKMYAIFANYETWQEVPSNLSVKHMEQSIAHWLGVYRKPELPKEVDSLLWSVTTLTSQVESSIAGQNGSHKIAIANARSNADKVRAVYQPKE
jgi:hypothetical protein